MRGTVIAAVSGGPQMVQIVDRAIELCKERSAPLWIVHVIDPEFLRGRAHMPKSTEHSLEHLGELFLEQCRQQAHKAGIDAELHIVTGPLVEELSQVVRLAQASVVVVGERKYHFISSRHAHDWDALEEETGARLEVVPLK